MNSHIPRPGFRIHRAFAPDSPAVRARLTAERIYMLVQKVGARQVRWHCGKMLTFPHPAPKGYGTRGAFVGIYTIDTRLEWIEEDLREVLGVTRYCESQQLSV
jgi:hypothetical protein